MTDISLKSSRTTRDRRLVFLVTCLLLFTIFFCGQLALVYTRVDSLPVAIVVSQTADYAPWAVQRFRQVDPQLGTQVVAESGETPLPPEVAAIPSSTPTFPQNTAVFTPTFTPSQMTITEQATATTNPSTQIPGATSTNTVVPSETVLQPTITSTPTAALQPTSTNTLVVFVPTATTQPQSPAPIANFIANPSAGTAPLTVTFTNLSSGNITGYSWNFGDNAGFSSVVQPSYTYNNPGSYTVTLTVTGPGGSASYSALVTVSAAVAPTNTISIQPTSTANIGITATLVLVTPTETATFLIIPTATATNTLLPPTSTATNTPLPPTSTATLTPIPPTPTWTPTFTVTATPSVTPTATPACSGGGNGLKGSYYDRNDFGDPRIVRNDSTINFDWGANSPDGSIGPNTFAVRWTGFIEPCTSETYTFYVTADESVKLWISGQQIITLNTPGTTAASINLTGGQRYSLLMDYKEADGDARVSLEWSSPSIAQTIIPQANLHQPATTPTMVCSGSGNGLQGDYYNDVNHTEYRASRTDGPINFDWGNTSPIPGIDPGTYSVRWTGQLEACATDTYLIYTEVDDGIRVWINGQPLIDRWTLADYSVDAVPVNLVGGQQYTIQIEMYNDPIFGRVRVYWETSTQPKTLIPLSQLYSVALTPTAIPSDTPMPLPTLSPTETATATPAPPLNALELTSMCMTYWRYRNTSAFDITVNWEVYGMGETGTFTAFAMTEGFFSTINNGTTVIVGSNGQTVVRAPNATPCAWLTATPTATLTHTETPSPTPTFTETATETPVPQVDLTIPQFLVSEANPIEGESVEYQIDVVNQGIDAATGVQIQTDLVFPDFIYVDQIPSGTAFNPATGIWEIGTINGLESVSIRLQIQLGAETAGNSYTNTVHIFAVDQTETDTTNNNNSVGITVQP